MSSASEKNPVQRLHESGAIRAITPGKKGTAVPDPSAAKKDDASKLKKDLDNSVIEGAIGNFSTSIVASYSVPYALLLNASNAEIGLMNSLQSLAGLLSQIPGARLARSMPRKRIWLLCSAISRIMLIPLVFVAFISGSSAVWILIISLSAFSFFTSMKIPAWSSMMGDIVPPGIRGKFFGKRNMLIGLAGIAATLSAGFMVQCSGFPAVFAFAIVVSSASLAFTSAIREPPMNAGIRYRYRMNFNLCDFLYSIKRNIAFAKFTAYLAFANFAVNVAAPFIAVYMIRELDIGYGWFAVVVTIGALSQIISHRHWGAAIDRFGSRKILIISGMLICFIPFGYMLSSGIAHLIIVKVFEGFAWGAFDLVCFNYLLAVTPSEKRPGYVANHNVIIGMGTVLGALSGGLMAQGLQSSEFLFLQGLQIVFFISFFLRLLSVGLLAGISDAGMKEIDRAPVRYVFWETVAVGPSKGIEHTIMNAFQYPYSVRIRKAFRMGDRKVRIRMKQSETRRQDVTAPLETKRKEVSRMAALRSGKPARFVEIKANVERRKFLRISVIRLNAFSDTDSVVRKIRERDLVFVDLKGMKRDRKDELKQSAAKINKACVECGSRLSLVEEEWLVASPPGAEFV